MIKLVYNVDVYIPFNIMKILNIYFTNIDTKAVPIAEENLCGFDKFWKEYSAENKRTLSQFLIMEYQRRQAETLEEFRLIPSQRKFLEMDKNKVQVIIFHEIISDSK